MSLAFEGIKVIEAATVFAAPMAGRLMADWGADVIHVEHPVRGDSSRSPQFAGIVGGRVIMSDVDYVIENFNRNKRSMTLDLSHELGRNIIYTMLEKADVLLSNFRPRELEKFKLEYETLVKINPRIICANLTGYGSKGPDRDLPGFETTGYFSRSGIHHVIQMPGTRLAQMPVSFGDNVAGLALVYGIITALFARERTGVGQEVDVSLFSTGVYALSYDIAAALVTGQDRQPVERKDVTNVLANYYETKDSRLLFLGIAQPDVYWSRLCQAIEREDLEHDPRFASFEAKIANHVLLFDILEEAFLARTLEEWKTRLSEAMIPFAPIQTFPEVISDPQARANEFFIAYNHPTYGNMEMVANPVKLGGNTAPVRLPAPEFGQHTEEVLLEYGYTWGDIEQFKEQGIIS
jgi:crotonobetainyl-CoA:carnitine CoA-transferase CaiB-like acyl-CoA transferase